MAVHGEDILAGGVNAIAALNAFAVEHVANWGAEVDVRPAKSQRISDSFKRVAKRMQQKLENSKRCQNGIASDASLDIVPVFLKNGKSGATGKHLFAPNTHGLNYAPSGGLYHGPNIGPGGRGNYNLPFGNLNAPPGIGRKRRSVYIETENFSSERCTGVKQLVFGYKKWCEKFLMACSKKEAMKRHEERFTDWFAKLNKLYHC